LGEVKMTVAQFYQSPGITQLRGVTPCADTTHAKSGEAADNPTPVKAASTNPWVI
jgi:hypothetical protein